MKKWILAMAMSGLALLAGACGDKAAPESKAPPALSTPEATLAEYQRTFNEQDWRAHLRLHTEDSLLSLLLPCFITWQGIPEFVEKQREILEKYVSPAPAPAGGTPQNPFAGLTDRVSDPEALFEESMTLIATARDMKAEMVGFEDLEVEGDTASAKKVMHYVDPTMNFKDRQPIHLRRVDGRWLVTMAR